MGRPGRNARALNRSIGTYGGGNLERLNNTTARLPTEPRGQPAHLTASSSVEEGRDAPQACVPLTDSLAPGSTATETLPRPPLSKTDAEARRRRLLRRARDECVVVDEELIAHLAGVGHVQEEIIFRLAQRQVAFGTSSEPLFQNLSFSLKGVQQMLSAVELFVYERLSIPLRTAPYGTLLPPELLRPEPRFQYYRLTHFDGIFFFLRSEFSDLAVVNCFRALTALVWLLIPFLHAPIYVARGASPVLVETLLLLLRHVGVGARDRDWRLCPGFITYPPGSVARGCKEVSPLAATGAQARGPLLPNFSGEAGVSAPEEAHEVPLGGLHLGYYRADRAFLFSAMGDRLMCEDHRYALGCTVAPPLPLLSLQPSTRPVVVDLPHGVTPPSTEGIAYIQEVCRQTYDTLNTPPCNTLPGPYQYFARYAKRAFHVECWLYFLAIFLLLSNLAVHRLTLVLFVLQSAIWASHGSMIGALVLVGVATVDVIARDSPVLNVSETFLTFAGQYALLPRLYSCYACALTLASLTNSVHLAMQARASAVRAVLECRSFAKRWLVKPSVSTQGALYGSLETLFDAVHAVTLDFFSYDVCTMLAFWYAVVTFEKAYRFPLTSLYAATSMVMMLFDRSPHPLRRRVWEERTLLVLVFGLVQLILSTASLSPVLLRVLTALVRAVLVVMYVNVHHCGPFAPSGDVDWTARTVLTPMGVRAEARPPPPTGPGSSRTRRARELLTPDVESGYLYTLLVVAMVYVDWWHNPREMYPYVPGSSMDKDPASVASWSMPLLGSREFDAALGNVLGLYEAVTTSQFVHVLPLTFFTPFMLTTFYRGAVETILEKEELPVTSDMLRFSVATVVQMVEVVLPHWAQVLMGAGQRAWAHVRLRLGATALASTLCRVRRWMGRGEPAPTPTSRRAAAAAAETARARGRQSSGKQEPPSGGPTLAEPRPTARAGGRPTAPITSVEERALLNVVASKSAEANPATGVLDETESEAASGPQAGEALQQDTDGAERSVPSSPSVSGGDGGNQQTQGADLREQEQKQEQEHEQEQKEVVEGEELQPLAEASQDCSTAVEAGTAAVESTGAQAPDSPVLQVHEEVVDTVVEGVKESPPPPASSCPPSAAGAGDEGKTVAATRPTPESKPLPPVETREKPAQEPAQEPAQKQPREQGGAAPTTAALGPRVSERRSPLTPVEAKPAGVRRSPPETPAVAEPKSIPSPRGNGKSTRATNAPAAPASKQSARGGAADAAVPTQTATPPSTESATPAFTVPRPRSVAAVEVRRPPSESVRKVAASPAGAPALSSAPTAPVALPRPRSQQSALISTGDSSPVVNTLEVVAADSDGEPSVGEKRSPTSAMEPEPADAPAPSVLVETHAILADPAPAEAEEEPPREVEAAVTTTPAAPLATPAGSQRAWLPRATTSPLPSHTPSPRPTLSPSGDSLDASAGVLRSSASYALATSLTPTDRVPLSVPLEESLVMEAERREWVERLARVMRGSEGGRPPTPSATPLGRSSESTSGTEAASTPPPPPPPPPPAPARPAEAEPPRDPTAATPPCLFTPPVSGGFSPPTEPALPRTPGTDRFGAMGPGLSSPFTENHGFGVEETGERLPGLTHSYLMRLLQLADEAPSAASGSDSRPATPESVLSEAGPIGGGLPRRANTSTVRSLWCSHGTECCPVPGEPEAAADGVELLFQPAMARAGASRGWPSPATASPPPAPIAGDASRDGSLGSPLYRVPFDTTGDGGDGGGGLHPRTPTPPFLSAAASAPFERPVQTVRTGAPAAPVSPPRPVGSAMQDGNWRARCHGGQPPAESRAPAPVSSAATPHRRERRSSGPVTPPVFAYTPWPPAGQPAEGLAVGTAGQGLRPAVQAAPQPVAAQEYVLPTGAYATPVVFMSGNALEPVYLNTGLTRATVPAVHEFTVTQSPSSLVYLQLPDGSVQAVPATMLGYPPGTSLAYFSPSGSYV